MVKMSVSISSPSGSAEADSKTVTDVQTVLGTVVGSGDIVTVFTPEEEAGQV